MPKKIYDQFLGGLSYYDRNAPENTYIEGIEIDPHRGLGYLQPGWLLSTVAISTGGSAVINDLITDMVFHTDGTQMYMCDDDRLYHMNDKLTGIFDDDFDGSNPYYAISGSNQVYKLAMYNVSGTIYLLYAYRKSGNSDVGIHTLGTTTFNDDYLSTDVGTGAAALSATLVDMVEWQTFMFISHGQYVGRFDGPNDVWDATKLDLGKGWEVTKLFTTQNYLGVCAAKKVAAVGHSEQVSARVFFWDGISPTFSYWTEINDYDIGTAINKDGEIYILSSGKDFAGTLRKLIDTGANKIRKLKPSIAGTPTNYDAPNQNAIDTVGNI